MHSGAASLFGAGPAWVPPAPSPDAGAASIRGLIRRLMTLNSQLAALLRDTAEQQGDATQSEAAASSASRAAAAASLEAALELGIAAPAAGLIGAAPQHQQLPAALAPAWEVPYLPESLHWY